MKKDEKKVINKKRFEGTVVSNKMAKAVVVKVSSRTPHPKYGKIVSRSKRFYARTNEELNIGDTVVIEETRPLSKLIRWQVIEKK